MLVQMSKISRTAMREGDVLVRYGGEEFLAILPAAPKHLAISAERLKTHLKRTTQRFMTHLQDQRVLKICYEWDQK